jgi:DNA-binding transcriptional LysR family regulator
VCGAGLEGGVRIGLQEDFGEHLLTETLGRFARSHPRVQIEATVALNAQLLELVLHGHLDLAPAWDTGSSTPHSQRIAELPMCWIGRADSPDRPEGEALSLVTFETPCLMRSAALKAMDQAGISWRVAFTSSSLSGIWAAVSAGLGITVRTRVGLPSQLRVLEGFPKLPKIGLILHRAHSKPAPHVRQLETILLDRLNDLLVTQRSILHTGEVAE